MDGGGLKKSLARAVRATGAEIHDRTAALKILTEDGRIRGVLGFNIWTGDYTFIKAKAICLTAGPAGRMGLASSGYLAGTYEFPGNSGDGYALAYEAGAELVNMECYQTLTMLKDFQGPACGFVAGTRGAIATNRVGEETWTHPYPSGDTRLATWRTFAEGKGPIYLHTHLLPEDIIQIIEHIQFGTERTGRRLFHKGRGQDYRHPRCLELAFAEEIGACGGHSSSGVNSNRRGETNIEGLFVAGDVDGGLPYSFLGGALAMGGMIGEEATKYAAEAGWMSGNPKPWVREVIREFEAPMRRKKGLPPHLAEFKARTRIQYYLKPPKNPEYHQIAIWWMERIRNDDLPEIRVDNYHDLLKAHELRSILLVGEMMARASLFREESRWGYQHWRADLPAKNTEWDATWVVVRKGTNGMELAKKKVPAYRWNFPTSMAYSYPKLSFDLGVPFAKAPCYKNPLGDLWTKARMEKNTQKGKTARKAGPR
jgi:succinate dehydrogenase/fumarate reductase flavoprotein subunit